MSSKIANLKKEKAVKMHNLAKTCVGGGGKYSKIAAALVASVSLFAALSAFAAESGQFDMNNYSHSFKITFKGYSGGTTLENFPALVRISQARNAFDYSASKVANGGDLRFVDADGNLLASEVDTWIENGESLVWVRIPSLTADTEITAYYGCETPDAVTASDVWSNGYVGVWHLGESALPLKESSGNSNPFATKKGSPLMAADGRVGGAVDFSNASEDWYFKSDDADALDGFANLTIEAWTKQTEVPDRNAFIVSKRTSTSSELSYYVYAYGAAQYPDRWGNSVFAISIDGTNGQTIFGSDANITPTINEWSHQVFVRDVDAKKAYGYISGTAVANKTANVVDNLHAGSGPLYLGNGNVANLAFNGLIDEVRISNVARSADWVKASHDTVADEDFAEYTIAAEDGWEKSFTRKFTVTFAWDGGTLVNFPALVRLSEYDETTGKGIQGFQYADFLKENGGDLRFADSAGNLVPFEIDTWNSNGESLVWVKIPSLGASTKLTAYYGNSIPPVVEGSVWDDNYVGVWHLGESALPLKESSGKSNPFATKNGSPSMAAEGCVGGGVDFNNAAADWYFLSNDADALDGFANLTIEAWTKQEAFLTRNAFLISKRETASKEMSYYVYTYGSATSNPERTSNSIFAISTSGTNGVTLVGSGDYVTPTTNEWCHQVFVRDVDVKKVYGYIGGEEVKNKTISNLDNLYAGSGPLYLGNGNATSSAFNGLIDEVRISNVARSADWVKASHDTVAEASFATYGDVKEIVNRKGLVIILK